MQYQQLVKRVAQLESLNDQLLSELQFLDEIARELGFAEGIKSLKSAAKELLDEQRDSYGSDEEKKQ